MKWTDLTYLLAVMRGGSLAQAARLLGVDKSTLSRRLAALETDLNTTLTEHARDGRISLTKTEQSVARRAETIEDEVHRLKGETGQKRALEGRVRLTAVPLIVNYLLLPQVDRLTGENPQLALELIADTRDLSLLDRDADIAVRLARPRAGGQSVIARRLGALRYSCYAADTAGNDLPWVGYEPGMMFMDHAGDIERLAALPGQSLSPLSVNDAQTLLSAVRGGHGKTLLPCLIADRIDGLKQLPMAGEQLPSREVWLLVRRDVRDLARVKAVVAWLETVLTLA